MVKVGDILVGKDSASSVYATTVKGWKGKVLWVDEASDRVRLKSLTDSYEFVVSLRHFEKAIPTEFTKFEVTEEMVRDLIKCPEGYAIHIKGNDYNPYTIVKDGYKDCEGDWIGDFADLLCALNEEEYKVVKINDVEEMTMEEICKALGKNIKIVKGDNE